MKTSDYKVDPTDHQDSLAFLKTDKEIMERSNIAVQNTYNAMQIIQTFDDQCDVVGITTISIKKDTFYTLNCKQR